jgi:hypothetical protein
MYIEYKEGWRKVMNTTINMHYEILEEVSLAAQARGISRSKIIIILLKKAMSDMPNPGRLGTMVQYQKSGKRGDWHGFHIKMRPDEYEYFQDMRKLLKMSVSLILAHAVKRYLNKILQKNITDNYLFKDYVIIREVIDNIICWRLLWGFPPNFKEIRPLSL